MYQVDYSKDSAGDCGFKRATFASTSAFMDEKGTGRCSGVSYEVLPILCQGSAIEQKGIRQISNKVPQGSGFPTPTHITNWSGLCISIYLRLSMRVSLFRSRYVRMTANYFLCSKAHNSLSASSSSDLRVATLDACEHFGRESSLVSDAVLWPFTTLTKDVVCSRLGCRGVFS